MVDVASQIGDVNFSVAGEGVAARLAQEGVGGRVYDLPEFSDISDYSDDGYSDAQEQWEESLRQLEQLVSFVLIPLIGKFFGRRAAYFVWGMVVDYRSPKKLHVTDSKAFNVSGVLGAVSL
ncbi:hypothetical protein LXG23DRAFT_54280 [Yarrowia lipolytica]|nr:hypothetical protein LXG23DRAFT_54280 [Yarrowia lipolytica]QNP99296.1 Hypothetical protein YALI2_E00612g [Yarrowia lipolytica]SEI33221.1 YALIA101S03e13080g1_1 [Yarrowia lipolytica]VBB77592.1 Conserved hypothetical protein [Yarrowia lipolytica]